MTFVYGLAVGVFVGFIVAVWRWDPELEEAYKRKSAEMDIFGIKAHEDQDVYEQQLVRAEIENGYLKKALAEKDALINELWSKINMKTVFHSDAAATSWAKEPERGREGVEIYE